VTPADVCDAIKFCDAIAHALPWGVIGAVVAALALTYGVTMSIALVVYVYRFRGQRIARYMAFARATSDTEKSRARDFSSFSDSTSAGKREQSNP
jgi:hypothetical protein